MPAATVLGAMVIGLFGLIGDAADQEAIEAAKQEAKTLEALRRRDAQIDSEKQDEMTALNLKQREREFAWEKGEARKTRAERAEEKGYQRRERHFDKSMTLLNADQTLRNNYLSFIRRAA